MDKVDRIIQISEKQIVLIGLHKDRTIMYLIDLTTAECHLIPQSIGKPSYIFSTSVLYERYLILLYTCL